MASRSKVSPSPGFEGTASSPFTGTGTSSKSLNDHGLYSTVRAVWVAGVGGHAHKPVEVNVLDPPADVDRLVHAPALIDVAHEVDIRSDRLANKPRPLHLALGRRVARQRELHLHLPEAFFSEHRR